MKGEKLGFCVVGCGMIGRIHARVAGRLRDRIELFLCDAETERAEALSAELRSAGVFRSYQEVLSDPARSSAAGTSVSRFSW